MPNVGTYAPHPIERVVYGKPAHEAVAAEVARIGAKRVFLLASRTLDRSTDLIARLRAALGPAFAGQYDGMPAHVPRLAMLEAAAAARAAEADLLVTYGGGSLTDAGKMVSHCLQHGITRPEQLDPFRDVQKPDGTRHSPVFEGPRVRQITVPTTLSGGEFNISGSATDEVTHHKDIYRNPAFCARVIVLDPAATVHTPEWLWLSSGVRAVDHCVETICASTATDQSDGMAIQGLKLLTRALPACKADPSDLRARLDCQIGTWLSMDHNMAGISMGASHGIGHVLGGTCDVNHGHTSCVMLPAVLRWNASVNAERQKLVAAAMGRPGEDAAEVVGDFIASIGMPRSLREVGVSENRFAEIAEHSMQDRYIHSNPRKITSPAQIVEILRMAA